MSVSITTRNSIIVQETYDDWFLPSRDELNQIQSTGVWITAGLASENYWSSTEIDSSDAWEHDDSPYPFEIGKSSTNHVRAIRFFTSITNYSLGDTGPAGGILFAWDHSTGYFEVAPTDQSVSQVWSNIDSVEIGVTAQGTAIGTGQANTTAIMSQVESEAGKTIVTCGTGGTYNNLQVALKAVWEGNLIGDIIIRLISNTFESAQAVLYENGHNGTANYNSVIIYPTVAGLTVSGSYADSLIVFNGASNVTIDGRVNRIGNTDMVINSGAYKAIEFINTPTNIKVLDTVVIEGMNGDIASVVSSAAKLCADLVV